MHHRRSSALAAGVLLLAAPVLSSCGFDYETDRINTISTGINDREGDIDVLGAVVVAGTDNAGLFVGTLANNSTSEPGELVSLTGTVDPIADQLDPVAVPPAGATSLFDLGGIPVQGIFGVGDFITVTLTFDSGQTNKLTVPVVKPCYQYDPAKFDPALVLPTPGADITEIAEAGGETTSEASGEYGPYSCEIEEVEIVHGGGEGEGEH